MANYGSGHVLIWCVGQLDADFQAVQTIMYGCFTPGDRPPEKGWIFVGKNVADPGAGQSFSIGDRTGNMKLMIFIYR